MKVSELLESRRRNWQELEALCDQMQSAVAMRSFNIFGWFAAIRGRDAHAALAKRLEDRGVHPQSFARFSALYRSACADLALADAYQLPPNTVQYLHRLVGRAHNQLYRSRHFKLSSWLHILMHDAPQRIFADRCIQVAFCTFWGVFILSAVLAYSKALW